MFDVAVVGGGLSGWYTAYQMLHLHPATSVLVLEASERIGGRLRSDNGYDLGGMWSWPGHDRRLNNLQKSLNVPAKESHNPVGEAVNGHPESFEEINFVGGAEQLVTRLASVTKKDSEVTVKLYSQATSITQSKEAVTIDTSDGASYEAKRVVVAMPPRIANRISFNPSLESAKAKAMENTPTWMAGASKAFLEYDSPFWRNKDILPANIPGGLMIFDASQDSLGKFAIGVFHAGKPQIFTPKSIREEVLPVLIRPFGLEIKAMLNNIIIKNWMEDKWVYTQADNGIAMAQAHKFGDPDLRTIHGRVHFAGTETENEYGHMEGALRAGERAAKELIDALLAERQ